MASDDDKVLQRNNNSRRVGFDSRQLKQRRESKVKQITKMRRLTNMSCLILLLVMMHPLSIQAKEGEPVTETDTTSAIVFVGDVDILEEPGSPEAGQPGSQGPQGSPGPGGGPGSKWYSLPQTGSVGNTASQLAGIIPLAGAVFFIYAAKPKRVSGSVKIKTF